MKNVLIIGIKSFISKNFIDDFSYKFNFFQHMNILKKKVKKIF